MTVYGTITSFSQSPQKRLIRRDIRQTTFTTGMCGKRTPIWTLYTRIFPMPQPSHELNAKEALRPIYEWNCQETYQTHPPWYPSRTPRNAKQSGLARTDETAPANDGDNFTPARASLLADKSEDSHASSHRRRARGRTLELLRGRLAVQEEFKIRSVASTKV